MNQELADVARKFGPHRFMNLFWSSLAIYISGDLPPVPIPGAVINYLSAHFRVCPECRAVARERVEKLGGMQIHYALLNLHDLG